MMKDRLFSWLIDNLINSNKQRFEYPGFIVENLGNMNREIFLPEQLMVELEKKIDPPLAYRIGKRFGYGFARISNLPKKNSVEFNLFVDFFVKLVETTCAGNITYTRNIKINEIEFSADEFIICRKNGLGHIMAEGAIAGIWAYMLNDPTVEAVQTKCQGRGDKRCVIIAAPATELRKKGLSPISYAKVEKDCTVNQAKYAELNKVRPVNYANNSFKNLLDASLITYDKGKVEYNGERYFLVETSSIYEIEKVLALKTSGSDKKNRKILWEVGFNYGKHLANIAKISNPYQFIMDFFPALGFGDILVINKDGKIEINIDYYPWVPDAEKTEFILIRAIFSGILSQSLKRNVNLKLMDKHIKSGHLSIHFKE
ncbi:hypothetical protein KJ780_03725 [Candidatus Micrarchaeota archaeon]|nr:hypothetical protein [Candidatus Micrarchaeota archaeon]